MKKVDKYFNGGFLMPKRQGGMLAFSKNNQSGFVAPRMDEGGIPFLPQQDPEMMYIDRFNTPLTKKEQKEFDEWVAKESERQGRDILMDKGAYDVQGFWKSGDYKKMDEDGHGSDKWKKPNHPTFSNQSKYHGVDGFYGGNWTPKSGYQPSKQTVDMYGPSYYSWLFGKEPHRREHLDMSRYTSGLNRPSPLYYRQGGGYSSSYHSNTPPKMDEGGFSTTDQTTFPMFPGPMVFPNPLTNLVTKGIGYIMGAGNKKHPVTKHAQPSAQQLRLYDQMRDLYANADQAFYRDHPNMINVPYSGKTIKLTKGRLTGANVDTGLLDYIKKTAAANKMDPYRLAALISRESTFGVGTGSDRAGSQQQLVSGWNVDQDYIPYSLDRFLGDRKVPGIGSRVDSRGWHFWVDDGDKVDNYLQSHPELLQQYQKKLASIKKLDRNATYFDLASKWINKPGGIKRYNPGAPNYENLYNQDLKLLQSDPAFSKYMMGKKFGGDISLPNVYPNQYVQRFADGGENDCPEGFAWNEQRQACTTPDGRTFEELKADNDAAWADIVKGAVGTAGLTYAGTKVPSMLKHPLIATIPDVIKTKSYKPYAMATTLAAGARVAPVVSKLPLIKDLYKAGAYRVGSQSSYPTRDIGDITAAILRKKDFGKYKGFITNVSPDEPQQDLLKKYIYGDNTNFEPTELNYRNLEKYEKANKKPFEKFKLLMSLKDGEALPFENILIQLASDYMDGIWGSGNNKTVDNLFEQYPELLDASGHPIQDEKQLFEFFKNKGSVRTGMKQPVPQVKPNIAGHQIYFDYDPVTDQVIATTQDLWKFNRKDYKKKWLKQLGLRDEFDYNAIRSAPPSWQEAGMPPKDLVLNRLYSFLNDYQKTKQVALMEHAGTPFVTLDRRPLKFIKSPNDLNSFSAASPAEELAPPPSEIIIDAGTSAPSNATNALNVATNLKPVAKATTSKIKTVADKTKPIVQRTIDANQIRPLNLRGVGLKDLNIKKRSKAKPRGRRFEEGGIVLNQYYPGGITSGFGVTDQTTILPNFLKNLNLPVYKVNPWANVTAQESLLPNFLRFRKFENPDASFRIGNQAAYQDFLNQGVVRSAPGGAPIQLEGLGQVARTTPFPSFAKGTFAPSYFSADRAGDVIFKTNVPTFKRGEANPVTGNIIRGSHWAARPIDLTTGAVMTEVPASQVDVFGGKPHWLRGYEKVFNPYDPIHTEIAGLKGLNSMVSSYQPQGLLEKFMFSYYDNKINDIDAQISKLKETGSAGGNTILPGSPNNDKYNDLIRLRNQYRNQKIQYRDKKVNNYVEKLIKSVPGGGFQESIGVGGFAQGVYPFKENPEFLMKVGTYPDYENVNELLQISKPFRGRENISVPLQITQYPETDTYSTILKRQPGKSLMRFQNIPRQSILDAVLRMRELERAGLKMDFAGDNLLLDPATEKISLIDLGTDYSKLADENVLANILNSKYDKNIMNVLRKRYSIAPSISDLRREAAISEAPITKQETSVNTAAENALNAAQSLRQVGITTANQPNRNVGKKERVVTKPITSKKVSLQGKKLDLDATKFKLKEKSKIPIKKGKSGGRRGFTLKYGGSYDVNSTLDVSEQELPKMIEELRKQGYEFKITY